MRITFEEVSVKATKRWVDSNGKKRQRTRRFLQTLNPFNKNSDGSIKTRDQITVEIRAELAAWMAKEEES